MTDDTRQPQRIQFSNGNEATLVRVSPEADIDQVIKSLHLAVPRSLLVLNGSTRDLPEAIRNGLTPLFDGLAGLVAGEQITVVTGGTKAGIFSLFGQALQKAGGAAAPCIGIAVAGRMHPARFEPNHSHFVIVEGKDWGEETALMYGVVDELSKNCPSLAIFAGGGDIAVSEMLHNVGQDREMIFISGSQGKADEIVAAGLKGQFDDKRVARIIQTGRITTFALERPVNEFIRLVSNHLITH